MRKKTIDEAYYDWLCKFIFNHNRRAHDYSRLILHLYNTEFKSSIELDENRAEDGIALRYRFGLSSGFDADAVERVLDIRSCSIFEMMIALSLRCEEDIMGDPTNIQVNRWFWLMMDNCGLSAMTNNEYDVDRVENIIDTLTNRTYGPNGEGGYFTVYNTGYDLRKVDLWYQMNWYLNSII